MNASVDGEEAAVVVEVVVEAVVVVVMGAVVVTELDESLVDLEVMGVRLAVLEQGHAMPQCVYSIHRDSANGPIVKFANVGDSVFHVFDCPSDVYAMLVCFLH